MKSDGRLGFLETIVGGGEDPVFYNGEVFDTSRGTGLVAKYFLYGGGSWGDYPADEAVHRKNELRRRDDPEGYAKWQKENLKKFGGVAEDVQADRRMRDTVEWNNRGRPVKPVDLTPSPETEHDRIVREEMAKHGYEPSGRDPKTGKIEFKQAGEPPWFLSILGDGYEMVGSVMHNLPKAKGAVGVAQKLETAVGSLLIGNVRDGDPVLERLHDRIANVGQKEAGGLDVLGLMRESPTLRDVSYALWAGHMQALTNFQQDLYADGEGTALLDHIFEMRESGTLESEDDYIDGLLSVLATMPRDFRTYALDKIQTHGSRDMIQASLQRRSVKVPQELIEPLHFLELDPNLFLELPYTKASRIGTDALERFSSLVQDSTYARLVAELEK